MILVLGATGTGVEGSHTYSFLSRLIRITHFFYLPRRRFPLVMSSSMDKAVVRCPYCIEDGSFKIMRRSGGTRHLCVDCTRFKASRQVQIYRSSVSL
jgi:hypothetical protein